MKNLKIYQAIASICLGTILITGCTNQYEAENIPKEDIVISTTETTIDSINETIKVLKVSEPLTEESIQLLKNEIDNTKENTVFAYILSNKETMNTEDILKYALEKQPNLQFYLIDNGTNLEQSYKDYPNVTYVKTEELLNNTIKEEYTSNEICNQLIEDLRKVSNQGQEFIEQYDFNQTINSIKQTYQNIDKEEIKEGLTKFSNYVSNTEIFKQTEKITEDMIQYLKPHIENAIPVIEETYETYKPVVEESIEKGKNKIKEWLEL